MEGARRRRQRDRSPRYRRRRAVILIRTGWGVGVAGEDRRKEGRWLSLGHCEDGAFTDLVGVERGDEVGHIKCGIFLQNRSRAF